MCDLKYHVVDLRSDTVTKPTKSMLEAITSAELGDDVYEEDVTVNKLEAKLASMLGKEAALFVPSGTMANLIAIMVHCNKRSSEVLVGDQSHIFKYEQGGAAHLAGVMVSTIKNNPDGTFDLDAMEQHMRGDDIHEPRTMLACVENTHNVCGGKVLPLEWLAEFASRAKRYNVALHMDGARIFNASEYLKVDPASIVKDMDSVAVCFSKSLGAPAGSALVGTKSCISEARRFRKTLGGGMRQVGVLAAPCIVALDEVVSLLSEDNKRAKRIAEAIKKLNCPAYKIDVSNQHTNIIKMDIDTKSGTTAFMIGERLLSVTPKELVNGCKTVKGEGIVLKTCPLSPTLLRLVTHFQISDIDVDYTIKKLIYVLMEIDNQNNK